MDRRALILDGLELSGLGLEIGAGYGPLVAGTPGMQVRVLDHLDQAGLIAKYARQGQPTDRIPPIDYVWSGQPFTELVGETRFDWIVASHVIEHVPDLAGFVNQCADILTEDGVLSLAVPDHRYSFDFYRTPSGLREMVDAAVQKRTLSSPGAAAEHFLYLARLEGQDGWSAGAPGEPEFIVPFETAVDRFERARSGLYVDVHAWVFTPHSFRLALEDLRAIGLVNMREARFHPTVGFEFFVQLSKSGDGPGLSRAALARAAVNEQVARRAAPPMAAPAARRSWAPRLPWSREN